MLDILGTKSKWHEGKAQQFLKTMDELYSEFDGYVNALNALFLESSKLNISVEIKGNKADNVDDAKRIFSSVKFVTSTFSDTIIIAFYGDEPIDNAFFLGYVGILLIPIFQTFFLREIYLRGTISMGDFYVLEKESKMLIVGPAINEAAECYEMTEWIGIICAPSASITYKNETGILQELIANDPTLQIKESENKETQIKIAEFYSGLRCFARYPIPTKRGIELDGLAIAWPIYAIYPKDKFDELFQKEMSTKKFQSSHIGYDIFLKLHNTRIFYERLNKAIQDGYIKEIDFGKLTGISITNDNEPEFKP